MTYGIKLLGHNNSLPVSSVSPALAFRGKATRITGAGMTYYPADSGYDFYFRSNYFGNSYDTLTVAGTPGIYKFYAGIYNSAVAPRYDLKFTASIPREIIVVTYRIVCPSIPTVFCNTISHTTKASVLGISQNGTSGGIPVWDIKTSISFPLGLVESTLISYITLYCFSEVVPADSTSSFGISAFSGTGQMTFTSDVKPLKIKDYVLFTSSTTPPSLQDTIYTRSFSPNPETPTLSIAKAGFMNSDFGRYDSRQYILQGWVSRSDGYWFYNAYMTTKYATAGLAVTPGGELDIALNAIKYEMSVGEIATSGAQTPSASPVTTSKLEAFPTYIPVIDCADYD